jgi:hypothetical protein
MAVIVAPVGDASLRQIGAAGDAEKQHPFGHGEVGGSGSRLACDHHSRCPNNSGSRAMLAATRRASSSVITLACIASVGVADDVTAGDLLGFPRRRKVAGHFPSL